LHSFLLLIRFPPRPTLFPYTTLFRSTLTVTTPYGCTYTSDPVNVLINAADFEAGTIDPDDGDFCDNSSVTPLTFLPADPLNPPRSEEHTSELQSRENLVCRLLLEKKK